MNIGTSRRFSALCIAAASLAHAQTFVPATGYPIAMGSGTGPYTVLAGDFNNDGRPDIAVLNATSSTVVVVLSGIGAQSPISLPGTPYKMAIGDFNLDGKLDLAVTIPGGATGRVQVLLGNGNGGFTAAAGSPLTAGGGAGPIVVGDFNGDGKPDIAVVNSNNSNGTLFLGNGQGGFSAGSTFGTGLAQDGLAAGDFNRDGKLDLVTGAAGGVVVLLGNGAGGFTAAGSPAGSGGAAISSLTVADFNGDGRPDVAVTNFASNNVTILLGNGSGGLTQAGTSTATGSGPTGVVAADFNGDGRADIALANYNNGTVSVFYGNGSGGLSASPGSPFTTGGNPSSIAVADFNGDGLPDFATANGSANTVSLLQNNLPNNYYVPAQLAFYAAAGQTTPLTQVAPEYSTQPSAINNISSASWLTTSFSGCSGGTCFIANPTGLSSGAYVGTVRDNGISPNIRFSFPLRATLNVAAPSGWLGPVKGTAIATGTGPEAIATGDFNGDGIPDLVVANGLSSNLNVFLGDGNGGFAQVYSQTVSSGAASLAVTVGDFNNDGKLDIALSNQTNGITIFLGDGTGGFAVTTGSPYPAGSNPGKLVTGDFNRDGKLDLAVVNGGTAARILLGDGFGGFALIQGPSGFGSTSGAWIATGDFNGDGKPDLVLSLAGGLLGYYLGDGLGGFQATAVTPQNLGVFVHNVEVADVNSDGRQDLIVTTLNNQVGVLLGNGDGTFQPPIYFAIPAATAGPQTVAIGDFDGDGKVDIAVTIGLSPTSTVAIYPGKGDGTFGTGVNFQSGAGSILLAAADFNRDGRMDLAAVNYADNNLRIYLGALTPVNVALIPVPPSTVNTGQSVTLTAVVSQAVASVFAPLTGNVTFYDGSSAISTVKLTSGSASYTYANLSAGAHTLRAVYNADGADIRSATGQATATVTANTVSGTPITFTSTPSSLLIFVDGPTAQATPFTLSLSSGTHTISAASPFPGSTGVRYVFSNWSDSSSLPAARTITVGSGLPTTYNAVYATQYQLSVAVTPTAGGTVTPASGGYYNSGATVTLTATPAAGYTFSGWTGNVGNAASATTTVTMTAPQTVTAKFVSKTGTATAVTLSAKPNPVLYGQSVAISAAVTPSAATGSVTFYDGATMLGTAPVLAGTATLTTMLAGSGIRPLSAYYTGDANYAPGGSAALPVTVKVNPGSGYLPAAASAAGPSPRMVKAIDLNGDGNTDVVVASTSGNSVSVLLGDGKGGFKAPLSYPVTAPTSMAIADFDGDGRLDVATASTSGAVNVLLGNGDGTFRPLPGPTGLAPLVMADFDGDGKADLAVSGSVNLLLGNGNGTFKSPTTISTSVPIALATGDFNGDGRADLAILIAGSLTIVSFNPTATATQTVPAGARWIAVGDFDGDGKLDLAVADGLSNNVSVLLGNGDGSLQAAKTYAAGASSTYITAADVNGDGKLDLVVTVQTTPAGLAVLLGNGDGTFQPAVNYAAGTNPVAVDVGDFNGDGVPDLVTANSGGTDISVLLGKAAGTPAPTITSLAPISAIVGTQPIVLTVNGANFCSGSQVFWNAQGLTTTFVNATSLTATIPAALIAAPTSASITVQNPGTSACGATTPTPVTSSTSSFLVGPALGNGGQGLNVDPVFNATFVKGSSTIVTGALSVRNADGSAARNVLANAFTVNGGQWLRVVSTAPGVVNIELNSAAIAGDGTFVGYVIYSAPGKAGQNLRSADSDCTQTATKVTFSSTGQATLHFDPLHFAFPTVQSLLDDTAVVKLGPSTDGAPRNPVNISIQPATLIGTTAACWLSVGPPNESLHTGVAIPVHVQGPLASGTYTGTLVATDGVNGAAADVDFNVGKTLTIDVPSISLLPSKPSQDVNLSVNGTGNLTFTAECVGCDPWLTIDQHSGALPGKLTVRIKDAKSYNDATAGYIRITGFDGAVKLNEVHLNVALGADTAPVTSPQIRDSKPVLQAFDYSERLSPGDWIQIFGTNLAPTSCQGNGCSWAASDFDGIQSKGPLQGVEVQVNGKKAYVAFVRSGAADNPPSPDQVNAQVPDDSQLPAADGPVSVQVFVNGVASNTVQVNKTKVSPALLFIPQAASATSAAKNYLAAQKADFTFLGLPGYPAIPAGSTFLVYAVGCGTTNPPLPSGQQVQPPLHFVTAPVEFTIGGVTVQAQGFMENIYAGLCRFNVTVPALSSTFTAGEKQVDVKLGGVSTGQTLFTTIGPAAP